MTSRSLLLAPLGVIVRGGLTSPWQNIDIDMISIFLTQNIGNIDILYCSALWPTYVFHYHQQSSQRRQCYSASRDVEMPNRILNFTPMIVCL